MDYCEYSQNGMVRKTTPVRNETSEYRGSVPENHSMIVKSTSPMKCSFRMLPSFDVDAC